LSSRSDLSKWPGGLWNTVLRVLDSHLHSEVGLQFCPDVIIGMYCVFQSSSPICTYVHMYVWM
jgi:hypothetical protein